MCVVGKTGGGRNEQDRLAGGGGPGPNGPVAGRPRPMATPATDSRAYANGRKGGGGINPAPKKDLFYKSVSLPRKYNSPPGGLYFGD